MAVNAVRVPNHKVYLKPRWADFLPRLSPHSPRKFCPQPLFCGIFAQQFAKILWLPFGNRLLLHLYCKFFPKCCDLRPSSPSEWGGRDAGVIHLWSEAKNYSLVVSLGVLPGESCSKVPPFTTMFLEIGFWMSYYWYNTILNYRSRDGTNEIQMVVNRRAIWMKHETILLFNR